VEGLRLQGLAIHASDGAIGDLGKKVFLISSGRLKNMTPILQTLVRLDWRVNETSVNGLRRLTV